MSQPQWLLLAFRVVIIAAFLSLTAWVVIYSRIAAWWRNPIGLTLVAKTIVIALLLIPTALSLFLNLNRETSLIAGWADVVLIGLITPIMIWRTIVWVQVSRRGLTGQLPAGDPESPGETQ